MRRLGPACAAWTMSVVAACGAVTTPPSSMPAVSAAAAPTPTTAPTLTSSPTVPHGLGSELEVHVLDEATTGPVLEFVSDGSAIVYSTGPTGEGPSEAAPDLWRYEPGPSARPELVWRNPNRERSIVKIAADLGTTLFVEIPIDGERAWNLWLTSDMEGEPILLDSHPGDPDVPSLVPSLAVYEPYVAWTSFDRGPSGAVSQLFVAEAPHWTPRLVLERAAAEAELWLPSLYGGLMVYTEIRYAQDRSTDERTVHLLDLGDPDGLSERLDASGMATMPLITGQTVVWKETDPGFNMFNWGRLVRYDLATGERETLSTWPQEYVNYPSIGSRFVAWWGADAFTFSVHDLMRRRARLVERHPTASETNVLRPHVSSDLLVWMQATFAGEDVRRELRWAWLPGAGDDR
jgi:hypothetical protein